MERDDLAPLAGFFCHGRPLVAGETVHLGEDAAHHMRVRRLDVGAAVFVADGVGHQAIGTITRLAKRDAEVQLTHVTRFPRPLEIHLMVPIADRDRMLWLAEKGTELGAASWRPVIWRRSRSVSPRGEGASFAARVTGRMQSALLQSRAPWLPIVHADASPEMAIDAVPGEGSRLVLDVRGDAIVGRSLSPPVTIAVGPEGGLEPSEFRLLADANFHPVSLGANVLRFETAAVAALAIVHSMLVSATPTRRPDG